MSLAPAPASIRLDANSHGLIMSPSEFDAVTEWDDEYRYELVHGVVIVSPIASEGEAGPNDELGYLLRSDRNQHPSGSVIDLTLPERYVHLPDGSRRRADRVIWAGLGRKPDPKNDVPTIVIEFVSRSSRDRRRDSIEKRQEYRDVGVKEYWIIDCFERRILVCFAEGTDRTITESESYTTPLLPGFELPLAKLVAIANEWS